MAKRIFDTLVIRFSRNFSTRLLSAAPALVVVCFLFCRAEKDFRELQELKTSHEEGVSITNRCVTTQFTDEKGIRLAHCLVLLFSSLAGSYDLGLSFLQFPGKTKAVRTAH